MYIVAVGNISGTINNINGGVSAGGDISGTINNGSVFSISADGDISGTINNVICTRFTAGYNISGTIDNVNMGFVNTDFAFHAISGDISGTISNVVIDFIETRAFYAPLGNISGTINNITMCDFGVGYDGIVFDGMILDPDANRDIFFAGIDISGTITNITMGKMNPDQTLNKSSTFHANGNISGTFSNINMGSVNYAAFYAGTYVGGSGNISATITNVVMGDVGDYGFYANGNISGIISDITIGNSTNFGLIGGFVAADGDISGTINNVLMGNFSKYGFYADMNMLGIIDNVIMGDINNTGQLFDGSAFYCKKGELSGIVSNVITGFVNGYSFNASAGNISAKISYVKSNGPFSTQLPVLFTGELLSCEFDCRGITDEIITRVDATAKIERCKLLSDPGVKSTISASASGTHVQIIYTIINNGVGNIDPDPDPTNYNIYGAPWT